MTFAVERLADRWTWWRLASVAWADPLDSRFAQRHGGRWNPPYSFPVLYVNEDRVTARLNLRAFISQWPYEPEDLRSDNGPVLVGLTLPRDQKVCDVHSPAGVKALGLPRTFPFDSQGDVIGHTRCQPLGERIKAAGLRGARTRSAQTRDGAGRELAWFPATSRSVATRTDTFAFDTWYWA